MLTRLKPCIEKDFNIISFDTEADAEGNTYVWCVAGYYQKKSIERVFTSRAACQKFLFEKRWYNTVLTGLNLAFDINTLYGRRNGFKWTVINNMGRLITAVPDAKCKAKYGFRRGNYLRVIDLGNWMQGLSLKNMAELFGFQGHIDKHILGVDGDKKELTHACLSHCWAGVEIFRQIQEKIHSLGGHIKLTGPATAMDLFRRKYLKKEHQIYDFAAKGESEEEKMKREEKVHYMKKIGKMCYVGGATQAFRLGLYNNVGYIDINSSYPAQMKKKNFPDMNSYKRYTKNLSIDFLKDLLEREEGQALVRVKAPKMLIPFLHSIHQSRLVFPTGELQRWYTFPELRYALELDYKILEIYEIASFRRLKSNMFEEFVTHMNEYKKTCKPVAKLLMNGLSGKFGERIPEGDSWELWDEEDVEVDYKNFFSINGQVWKYTKQEKTTPEDLEFARYAYPLLIAYITAYGRIQEHKAIMAIGPEKVYYMDTDSIIADQKAIDQAVKKGAIEIHDTKLGAYGFEYKNATVEIRGEKYYRIRNSGEAWVYHIKGVPKEHMSQHWKYRISAYHRPRKIKTALRSGKKVNEFIRVFHRDISPPCKRIFKGRASKPLEIQE